jgi:hypothetical protein
MHHLRDRPPLMPPPPQNRPIPQDVAALLSKAPSEAHREAAALREAQLALKLEAGRLGRAEMMMRQKVQDGLRTTCLALHLLPFCCVQECHTPIIKKPAANNEQPTLLQVAYVERVNCELSEMMERCDADAMAAQVGGRRALES